VNFHSFDQARAEWEAVRPHFEKAGVVLPDVKAFLCEDWKRDHTLAMDAIPGLFTDPSSAVPAMLTTMIDPTIYEILFTPNKAAQIFGEVRKGTWLDETIMFPQVEHTGEVTSYGDFSENGHAGANTNWPQRQAYLFQTVKEYGERELERAGLARLNWVSEIDRAATTVLNKFLNFVYFFGVQGLQNYGAFNDPNLSTALSPALKAAGGTVWILNGVINAQANEVYADIQALFYKLVSQTNGLVQATDSMILAMSPQSSVALTATNTFNVNVYDLLKKNYPNMRVETAVQYASTSTSNPQGNSAANLVQLIAPNIEGQQTAYCAFNEKLRAHPIIRAMSSYKQKMTSGAWGFVLRMPFGIAQMTGV